MDSAGEIKPCAKTEISESMRMQAFIYTNVAFFFFFFEKIKASLTFRQSNACRKFKESISSIRLIMKTSAGPNHLSLQRQILKTLLSNSVVFMFILINTILM